MKKCLEKKTFYKMQGVSPRETKNLTEKAEE